MVVAADAVPWRLGVAMRQPRDMKRMAPPGRAAHTVGPRTNGGMHERPDESACATGFGRSLAGGPTGARVRATN
jgi:hypothetical protein